MHWPFQNMVPPVTLINFIWFSLFYFIEAYIWNIFLAEMTFTKKGGGLIKALWHSSLENYLGQAFDIESQKF